MCIKLSSLCRRFVVGCMEFGWVVDWVGSLVQSFYFAMGWVGLKKLDPQTTLLTVSTVTFVLYCVLLAIYTVSGKNVNPSTILNRNVKAQGSLTKLCASYFEYIYERTAKIRCKIEISVKFRRQT